MRTEDIKKLIRADYKIVSSLDYPRPQIVHFSKLTEQWELYSYYATKAERDKALNIMLQDKKTILD